MSNYDPIIVLGMHRSGTSAIAGVLHHLGVNMGSDLMLGDSDVNPKGYYEDRPVMKLNEDVLAVWGGSWDRVPVVIPRFLGLPNELKVSVLTYIEQRAESGQPWGWKDPRTCLTLPIYLPLFDYPKIIVVKRDPVAVLRSLDKREKKKTRQECEVLMQLYDFRLAHNTQNTINLTIQYEDLIADTDETVKLLIEYVELNPSTQQIKAAMSHIVPELNRNG